MGERWVRGADEMGVWGGSIGPKYQKSFIDAAFGEEKVE
jgi:hypothetical protein